MEPCRLLSSSLILRQNEILNVNEPASTQPEYDEKDRSEKIDLDTSIRYMNSEAYKTTYGDDVVWKHYRRNTKNPHSKTRESCIRANKVSTASPCPICRDKYLVLDYRHTKLLEQFVSPYTGEALPTRKTGLCQKQQRKLEVHILKAKDYGTITFDVPFRHYDYYYYQKLANRRKND